MASLNLKNIFKVYPSGVTAVTDFNLDIEDKEFIVFVGPSGCGKSTTLRMIAGLEDITSGELYIDGQLMNNIAPKDRDIAMVFQNYALYPHMTVYDNMAFGLKLRKMHRAEIDQRVKEAARVLGIEMYLSRKPKALSGGQRQRVALGRAIVREPKVFLLDEPLSNLDAKLRSQMRTEITKLHNRLATTFIYVTHDQIEAMTMGTRIVVMKDGFMQQVDTPMNLYDHPINQFVAGFIGTPQMNFFDATLEGTKNKVYVIIGKDRILLPKEKVDLICGLEKYLNTGRQIVFGIRPEDIHDDKEESASEGIAHISVYIDVIEELGAETLIYAKTRSYLEEMEGKSIAEDVPNLIAKVGNRSNAKVREMFKVAIDMKNCHLFDKATELTIVAADNHDKETVEALQAEREREMAEKAAALEAARLEEEAKAAAELEKKRLKLEKREARHHKKDNNTVEVEIEETEIIAESEPVQPVEEADKKADEKAKDVSEEK